MSYILKIDFMKKILFVIWAIIVCGCITAQVKYDKIEAFGSRGNMRLALIQKNNKFGFINVNGKEIVSPKYDRIEAFGSRGNMRLALIQKNNKFGFIDINGKEISDSDITE
jgi:hypothetical protein